MPLQILKVTPRDASEDDAAPADGTGRGGEVAQFPTGAAARLPFALRLRHYLALEMLLWFGVPLGFLALYVLKFHNPAGVILEHLYPVALIAGFSLLVKVCLRRLLPWRLAADAISTVVYVSVLMLLSTYYLLVAMGMRSWGKVISEELIIANVTQARQLCDATGYPFTAIVTGAALLWLALVALHLTLARRLEPRALRSIAFPPLTTLMALSLLLLVSYRLMIFVTEPSTTTTEPFQMTLTVGKGPGAVREHSIVFDPAFDKEEIAARQAYQPAATAERRNVILIIADGLRAQNMQAYGYGRANTPNLQRMLTDEGYERFDNVHSFCAESNCGTVSLLSSRDANRIPSEPFTFAQVLKQHGYAIHMVMGGDQTNYYNKRALFGKVDSYFDGSMAEGYYMSDDSFVVPKTMELPKWNGKPAMLQFHFMSTHVLGKRLPTYEAYSPSESYAGTYEGQPQQSYTNFYDNGVYQFDAFVRQVLDTVRSKKYLDNAIVIITSDHGESLGEKGRFTHGWGVHEPLLHIPLFISGLKARPALAGRPFIAQTDIAPTVLHELGMPMPSTWSGSPIQLVQAAATNRGLSRFEMHEFAGVFDGRQPGHQWKYVLNRYTKEEFVYDLLRDPQELHNVLAPPAELLAQWRANVTPDAPHQLVTTAAR